MEGPNMVFRVGFSDNLQVSEKPNSGSRSPQDASAQGDANSDPVVCTSGGQPVQTDPLQALAAALIGLSPADRARLAAMLLGQQQG
jgi:hypothetical protein